MPASSTTEFIARRMRGVLSVHTKTNTPRGGRAIGAGIGAVQAVEADPQTQDEGRRAARMVEFAPSHGCIASHL